jgi:His/Glu/Gln/Arg/opine family amino acid ABC transporter permease subunit
MNSILKPLIDAIPTIVNATLLTLGASVVCMVLSMAIAIPAGLGRLSRVTIIRSVSTFYVETIRGTPLLLQLLIWFFAVQLLLQSLFNFNIQVAIYNVLTALNSNNLYNRVTWLSGFVFAVIGLSFNYGAYLAEVIRAGVLAVEQGQTEAAQTLGLSGFQTTRFVVLPQALRIMIPPLTNNFITLVQDTAFFQVLGVAELSLVTEDLAKSTSNPPIRWEFYITELAIYFAICYSLALVSRRTERRVARGMAGAH